MLVTHVKWFNPKYSTSSFSNFNRLFKLSIMLIGTLHTPIALIFVWFNNASVNIPAGLEKLINQAGMLTEALLNHTNIKAIGVCNVPINMIDSLIFVWFN